jgi:hypothetical protein
MWAWTGSEQHWVVGCGFVFVFDETDWLNSHHHIEYEDD